jgi:hypothetical protein
MKIKKTITSKNEYQRLLDVQAAYQKVFSAGSGKVVLEDLASLCRPFSGVTGGNVSTDMAMYNSGLKDAFLYIIGFLETDFVFEEKEVKNARRSTNR